jgi:LmbE family N-acetylglucosaminyl deacetylase
MKRLALAAPGETLRVLALGAHSDDIEIGAGGTILSWIAEGVKLEITWCALAAADERAKEARASAEDFLTGAAAIDIRLGAFRDGYFPAERAAVKDWVEGLKAAPNPDVILTHTSGDAHQDHRLLCELAWNTFRDHLILEFEIPKWDGDLGRPSLYAPLSEEIMTAKIALLNKHFVTQRSRAWFDEETFRGLARLRGVECRARYAEAFFARKVMV